MVVRVRPNPNIEPIRMCVFSTSFSLLLNGHIPALTSRNMKYLSKQAVGKVQNIAC